MNRVRTAATIVALATVMMTSMARAQSPELPALPKPETYLPKIKAELERMDKAADIGPFKPDLESFKNHRQPEWLKDAKFGLWYSCAGVIVATERISPKEVPQADWWCKYMYVPGHPAFEAQRKMFGDQKTFGLKDLFPLLKMEQFNPEEFALLCVESGAKYGGLTGAWHENFFFWDSDVHRWNTKLLGPKRDIAGEIYAALEKRGLRKYVYFGHEVSHGYGKLALEYDAADPQWSDLYGKGTVDQEYIDRYLASVNEFNRKYSPDLIYYDNGCLGETVGRTNLYRHIAAFYNMAAAKGKEVDMLVKRFDVLPYLGVMEFESHNLKRLHPFIWTDSVPINSTWWLQKNTGYWKPEGLIANLVDIVSKNGVLNLAIPVRSDGTIPDEAKRPLRLAGEWLKLNGEAIYGTRSWRVAEEGEMINRGYKGVHFTRKDSVFYVIAGVWPTAPLTIKSMAQGSVLCPEEIAGVTLLGHGPVKWTRTEDGLVIQPPEKKPCDYAWVFKVETKGRTCTESQLTIADDDGNFIATVNVNNYTAESWSPQVKLIVDGNELAVQPANVAPGQSQVLHYSGKLPGTGLHKIGFEADAVRSGTLLAQAPRMALAGAWKFKSGDDAGFSKPALDDKDWQTVTLPASWNRHSGIDKQKPAVGWFHRTLQLPVEAKGHRLKINLGHISQSGWVYFNGHPIGEAEFLSMGWPQEFDVPAEFTKPGEPNLIAVKVSSGAGINGGLIKNMGFLEFLEK